MAKKTSKRKTLNILDKIKNIANLIILKSFVISVQTLNFLQ